MKRKSIFIMVACLLFGAFAFSGCGQDTKANSVMTCSVNPEVQFVLNAQNQVVSINYLNEDAQNLLVGVNLVGKSAEETASVFVSLSAELGYIDADTKGTKVEITFSGKTDADFESVKAKVVAKVNKYFDDNGIIAGAVAKTNSDLSSTLEELNVSASTLSGKTEEQLLELISENSNSLQDLAFSQYDTLVAFIESTLKTIDWQTIETMIETQESNIDTLNKQISNSNLPETQKTLAKQRLATAQKTLATLKEQLKTRKAQFEEALSTKVAELKTASKTLIANAKTEHARRIEANKTELSARKTYYNANKETVKGLISTYRASLA